MATEVRAHPTLRFGYHTFIPKEAYAEVVTIGRPEQQTHGFIVKDSSGKIIAALKRNTTINNWSRDFLSRCVIVGDFDHFSTDTLEKAYDDQSRKANYFWLGVIIGIASLAALIFRHHPYKKIGVVVGFSTSALLLILDRGYSPRKSEQIAFDIVRRVMTLCHVKSNDGLATVSNTTPYAIQRNDYKY